MKMPKAMFNIGVYDSLPKDGDWHKAKYLIHEWYTNEDDIWTNDINDVLKHIKSRIIGSVEREEKDELQARDFIMQPNHKVLLKATGKNAYAGGDSKWHLVTGYMIDGGHSHLEEDEENLHKSVFMMFSWRGVDNDRGVSIRMNGDFCENLTFKNSDTGKSITPREAVDLIIGRTAVKQQKENKNGRHNDKKTDRRKVQKVRPIRD